MLAVPPQAPPITLARHGRIEGVDLAKPWADLPFGPRSRDPHVLNPRAAGSRHFVNSAAEKLYLDPPDSHQYPVVRL